MSAPQASVDWGALRAAATAAAAGAYAPYSRYPVGAAALLHDGRVVVGCNVENASYGLTVCAEVGMVSAVYATGGGAMVAVAVTGADGGDLACCGRCRQILYEHGGPTLLVNERPMAEWLPHAWGPADLPPADLPPGDLPPGDLPPGDLPPGDLPPAGAPQ